MDRGVESQPSFSILHPGGPRTHGGALSVGLQGFDLNYWIILIFGLTFGWNSVCPKYRVEIHCSYWIYWIFWTWRKKSCTTCPHPPSPQRLCPCVCHVIKDPKWCIKILPVVFTWNTSIKASTMPGSGASRPSWHFLELWCETCTI